MGLGALLVLENELTAGGMIAGSILMARALAPVEQSIEAWRSAVMARASYARLRDLFQRSPVAAPSPPLPAPDGTLSVEAVSFAYPGGSEPTLRNVSFKLTPGESLGLIGRTASGKTTLARLLVGIHAPQRGHVRLDGADMARWDARDRGQYVGYMPQDVELFPGTVRENIARLDDGDPQGVYAAAQMVGLHEEILRLPDGYETEIGIGGMALSGGQRQKIALARAIYGRPRIVVLDEPNSNLDLVGESALIHTLQQLRAAQTTVVIIAHRPGALRTVDKIVVLNNGTVEMMGPRDEVFARVAGPALAGAGDPASAGAVSAQGGS
jgi:PrtD family type I secretion system ABC transporter